MKSDLATELSGRHTIRLGTRTLDVLHVASALTLESTHFVSYDERQRALAKVAGLRLLAPDPVLNLVSTEEPFLC